MWFSLLESLKQCLYFVIQSSWFKACFWLIKQVFFCFFFFICIRYEIFFSAFLRFSFYFSEGKSITRICLEIRGIGLMDFFFFLLHLYCWKFAIMFLNAKKGRLRYLQITNASKLCSETLEACCLKLMVSTSNFDISSDHQSS